MRRAEYRLLLCSEDTRVQVAVVFTEIYSYSTNTLVHASVIRVGISDGIFSAWRWFWWGSGRSWMLLMCSLRQGVTGVLITSLHDSGGGYTMRTRTPGTSLRSPQKYCQCVTQIPYRYCDTGVSAQCCRSLFLFILLSTLDQCYWRACKHSLMNTVCIVRNRTHTAQLVTVINFKQQVFKAPGLLK